VRSGRHDHFGSWEFYISPRKDLLHPEQTKEFHLVVKMDEEQSSGRVGEETYAVIRTRSLLNVGSIWRGVQESNEEGG